MKVKQFQSTRFEIISSTRRCCVSIEIYFQTCNNTPAHKYRHIYLFKKLMFTTSLFLDFCFLKFGIKRLILSPFLSEMEHSGRFEALAAYHS